MTDKFYIDDNNSVALPVYIKNFISNNKDDLKSIYETNSNNKEGFLYLDCDETTNNVDVSFLERTYYTQIITDTEKYKTWDKVKSDAGDNNIYIVKCKTCNLIIIIYI